jgi:hypothetical protein
MDAATLLSLGPPDCCAGVADRKGAPRLSSGPPVVRVVPAPMEAAILVSLWPALGREATAGVKRLGAYPQG